MPIKFYKGCAISYRFTTTPADISFGLYFRDANGNESTLKEMDRVPSHIGAANGTIHPACAGVIFFRWDNTYSWLIAKELTYLIEVSNEQSVGSSMDSRIERNNPSPAAKSDVSSLVAETVLKKVKAMQEQICESSKYKEDLLHLQARSTDEMRIITDKLNAANAEKRAVEGELGSMRSIIENMQAHRKDAESRHSSFVEAQNARYESEIMSLKTSCGKFKASNEFLLSAEQAANDALRNHKLDMQALKAAHDLLAENEEELQQQIARYESDSQSSRAAFQKALVNAQEDAAASRDEARLLSDKLQAALGDKAAAERDLASARANAQKDAAASRDEARLLSDKLQAALGDKAAAERAAQRDLASTRAGSVDLQAHQEAIIKAQKEAKLAFDKLQAALIEKTALEKELASAKAHRNNMDASGEAVLKKYEHEVQALRAQNRTLMESEQELRAQRLANESLRNEVLSLKRANDSLIQDRLVRTKRQKDELAASVQSPAKIVEVKNVVITARDVPVNIHGHQVPSRPAPVHPRAEDPAHPAQTEAPESPKGAPEPQVLLPLPSHPAPHLDKHADEMHPLLVPVNAGLFVLTLGRVNAWTADAEHSEGSPDAAPRAHGAPHADGSPKPMAEVNELNALKAPKPVPPRASIYHQSPEPEVPTQPSLKGILKKTEVFVQEAQSQPSQGGTSGWGWLSQL